MAKLSGALKDEEKFGGFNSDPNDDTFLLAKNMVYPGEIPDFDTNTEKTEVEAVANEDELEVNYEGVTKAPLISLGDQPQAESVWDMFDNPTEPAVETESDIQGNTETLPEEPDDSFSSIAEGSNTDEEPIAAPEKEDYEMQEIPAPNEPIVDEDVQPGQYNEEIAPVDDSISGFERDIIEQDELPGPELNEIEPEQIESFAAEPEFTDTEIDTPAIEEKFEIAVKELDEPSEETMNKSIENIEEYEEISLDDDFKKQLLDDLEKSKKKKKKDEQEDVIVKKVSLTDEEPVLEKITFGDYRADHPSTFGIDGEEEEGEEENTKKSRFIFPWKYFGYAAGILVLLTGLSIGGYYLVTQTELFTASDEKEQEPKKEVPAKGQVKAIAKPAKKSEKVKPRVEPKPDTTHKAIAAVEGHKLVKPRWETTDIPEKKQYTEPVHRENHPVRTSITNNTRAEKPLKQAVISTKEQIYTVELYSTPSADDAKMWAQKLKSRNLDNINITQHKIRDKVIYKIRFGKYGTREEAKTEAIKLGYPQTWVDRVK